MNTSINDFVLQVATINGSGSQSSNNILVKTLFRMGLPVGGKNMFPSNIQGLPTWFTIRASEKGYTARKAQQDILVAMNASTALEDMKGLKPGGIFIYGREFKLDPKLLRSDVINYDVPFKELADRVTDSIKLKKLLINMIYVGILQELLDLDENVLKGVVRDQFHGKESVIDQNMAAVDCGRRYAVEYLKPSEFPVKVKSLIGGNQDKVLIDGNSSAALGLMYGGCTFVAWYPITPSSSLVESFSHYADQHRLTPEGEKTFAVVQAEDELSSICMVLGAGWAGARALTATSGPGLSLMAEGAGLAYYAEIPSVIWNVQRVGPSTGLPTRTMQGDLRASSGLSHGDCKHVVLMPGSPEECFEFGQTCFDLAERLNTLVIVLSDLDLGMNLHMAKEFKATQKAFDRGKVLNAQDLESLNSWGRYQDKDGDGITYRTLPGTPHPKAAYFTRGTGHDEQANYSENNEVYKRNMQRLARKYQSAKQYVPKPVIEKRVGAQLGIIAFGSSDAPMREARETLEAKGITTNYLRLRALPFTDEVEKFLRDNPRVYVVEQNRDAQLLSLLRDQFPTLAQNCRSILQYDGLPLEARLIVDGIQAEGQL